MSPQKPHLEVDSELVIADTQDPDGKMLRLLRLHRDGSLSIVGHDIGPGVARVFAGSSYRFERSLTPPATQELLATLQLRLDTQTLPALLRRFGTAHALEHYLARMAIPSTLRTHVGS